MMPRALTKSEARVFFRPRLAIGIHFPILDHVETITGAPLRLRRGAHDDMSPKVRVAFRLRRGGWK